MTFQYKVEALDFVVKDDPRKIPERICKCMENVIEKYANIRKGAGKTYVITRQNRKQILEYEEIMFFETSENAHRINVHLSDKHIEFFGEIKKIEDEVGDAFIRSHRAYLVNKKNIKEINYTDKMIIMKNDAKCLISDRMLKYMK